MSSEFTYVGRGVYSAAEAARLIHLTPTRVRRWLRGYSYVQRGKRISRPPVVGFAEPSERVAHSLSFADLIEVLFLDHYIEQGVKMRTIRAAAEKARAVLNTSHPWSTHRFKTDGKWILHEITSESGDRALVNLITEQHKSDALLRTMLRGDLDLDVHHTVERWWPQGRKRDVVIDPRRRFGAPIVSSVGIPTRILYRSYLTESSYRAVARWYDIPERAVRHAVAFENDLLAA